MASCRSCPRVLAWKISVCWWMHCATFVCCFSFVTKHIMPHSMCERISKRNCWWSNWVGWIRMPKRKSICSYELRKWIHPTSIAVDFSTLIEIYLNRYVEYSSPLFCLWIICFSARNISKRAKIASSLCGRAINFSFALFVFCFSCLAVADDNGDIFGGVAAVPNQHTGWGIHFKWHRHSQCNAHLMGCRQCCHCNRYCKLLRQCNKINTCLFRRLD